MVGKILSTLAVVAFALICLTGVDLTNGRIGPGLLMLGAAVFGLGVLVLAGVRSQSRPWLIFLSLLGGAYFIWRAVAVGPASLAVADGIVLLSGLGVYLAASAIPAGSRWIWVVALGLLAFLNAGFGILQKVSATPYYLWYESLGDGKKVCGIFGHYNAFASFLNGSIFFFLSYLFLGHTRWLRVVCGLLSVVIVTGVVFSGSRGGWLSLIPGAVVWFVLLVLFLFLNRKDSKMVGLVSVLGVLVMVVGVVTSIPMVKKLTAERKETDTPVEEVEVNLAESDGDRFVFQQMAFEVFQDAPLFGQGPRAFSYRSLEKWDPDSFKVRNALPVFAHNEYLQVLSDYGLIGFSIVIGLFFLHAILGAGGIVGLSERESRDPHLPIWQLGAAGGMISILCQSFFSFLFHFPACVALVAFQLSVLGARSFLPTGDPETVRGPGRLLALPVSGVALALAFLGWPLTQSFLLSQSARDQLASARSPETLVKGLETLTQAANYSREPDLLEVVARRSMGEANAALQEGDVALAREFNLRAKAALERALEMNPYFGEAIAGLPRIEDALGNYEEADKGHQRAMTELWMRESTFQPHLQAARSSYFRAFRAKDDGERFALLREARRRLDRRKEILELRDFRTPVKEFSQEVDAWITFHEGRLLFMKGDEVWKKARPRQPEMAHALFIEAQKRYLECGKLIRDREPRWEPDQKQLGLYLEIMKNGRIQPAPLGDEAVRRLLDPDPGLASGESNR